MTSIIEELRADSGFTKCAFGEWLARQDDETRDAITAAFSDDKITFAAIFRWAKHHDYENGEGVVKIHGREGCVCFR